MVSWSVTNLVIQIVAAVLGGHAAALTAHEHSFGFIAHTLAGAIGGALSGYFLQIKVTTLVMGSGALNDVDAASQAVLQMLAGFAVGAITTLAIGFLKHGIEHHRAGKKQP